jgi:hypothetical protein
MHLVELASRMCPARHLDQPCFPGQRIGTIEFIEPYISIGMQEATAAFEQRLRLFGYAVWGKR